MKNRQLLFLLILVASWCTACIVEHDSFHAVTYYLYPHDLHGKTLVILDIDNTLAQPESILGSEEWFGSHAQ